jgi:hypothetical protein
MGLRSRCSRWPASNRSTRRVEDNVVADCLTMAKQLMASQARSGHIPAAAHGRFDEVKAFDVGSDAIGRWTVPGGLLVVLHTQSGG